MPEFNFKGRDQMGKEVDGVLRAPHEGAVVDQLLHRGVTPLSINQVKRGALEGSFEFSRKWPEADDLVQFARQMHALIKSGVPILRAIQGLSEISHNSELANALEEIMGELSAGKNLSEAMSKHPKCFNALFINMVSIGEETGRMEEAFQQLYEYIEVEMTTAQQITAAMRYPVFVTAAIFVAIFVLNMFVIPAFKGVFANLGSDLPWATQILIASSEFTRDYWPFILIVVFGSVGGFMYYIKTEEGRIWWDGKKMGLPLVGKVITMAVMARFSRAFAMGSRSGVPILTTLAAVSRAVDNLFVAHKVMEMRSGIEVGESITQAATASDLFTPLVLQMMSVGEETGAMETMMQDVAEFYEREVAYAVKAMSSAIEPIMLTFIGGIVLVMALGIFLPMWEMGGAAL